MATRLNLGAKINKLLDLGKYSDARRLIMRALRAEPGSHWLLTRLGVTYYEQHRYREALKAARKALKLAPRCPLVLWDYACDLDMLENERAAIKIWKQLIRRGAKSLAYEECGEGIRWAGSLINDCRYRIGSSYLDLGDREKAVRYMRAHLAHRPSGGAASIYTLKDVRSRLRKALKL